MNQIWNYPGARWWKFDFHTHTPASADTPWHRLVGRSGELTPEMWLLKYMAAEIDCVAVTDHNSGEWIDKLKAAYAAMQRQSEAGQAPAGFRALHLFPGVEISVQGGFHLLAIFDPSASSQTISDLLAKVDYDGTRGDSDGVTRKGAVEVVAKVLDEGGLAIPAHVDGEKGLLQIQEGARKSLLDANTVRQVLKEPGLLALEWLGPANLGPVLLDELKRPFARVLGSDCHNFQGSAVPGSRYTWIKMATPSLEGLRLALLDGQGISVRRSDDEEKFAPLSKPEHFIESIEIRDARFMGRGKEPALFKLNPYFNALIGGRGTGKSTVVHALRLAYRRERELPEKSEAGQTFVRFNQVAKSRSTEGGLQADTSISIQVHRDGMSYRLLWRQDGQGQVVEEWDATSQSFKPSASQAINEQRFPLRLFSQGQIAALAGDSQQALLKVIDDAAGTNVQQKAFEEAKQTFLAIRAQMRELDGKLQGRDALNLALQDVQRKLARFEGADHAAVLKNYQRTSRQGRELDRQFEHAAELAERLKDAAENLLAEDLPEGLFDATHDLPALEIVQRLKVAIDQARADLARAAASLAAQVPLLQSQLADSPWFAGLGAAKSAYDQLKADLQQQGVSDPSEYGRLVQEKQRLESEIRQIDLLAERFEELKQKNRQSFDAMWECRRDISRVRRNFLDKILVGNSYVQMNLLEYLGDFESLRGMDSHSDSEEKRHEKRVPIWSGLSVSDREEIIKSSQKSKLKNILGNENDFDRFLDDPRKTLVKTGRPNGGWRFSVSENEDAHDHWLTWIAEDAIEITYSRKADGKNFQPIAQASAGQRAAAMLAFLLAHGDEPLVLDQPEDDLDNHLIYGMVVQQIRSQKQRRQLIVVTHNPNIVVNGDAELIHVLDFNQQCFVKATGALQDQKIRDEVCQVMEGGVEAFERRYQRLGREV
jgi:energy-coupling factor transporter ATP-binding protein EcfA2